MVDRQPERQPNLFTHCAWMSGFLKGQGSVLAMFGIRPTVSRSVHPTSQSFLNCAA